MNPPLMIIGTFFFLPSTPANLLRLSTETSISLISQFNLPHIHQPPNMSRFGAKRGRKLPGQEFTWDNEPGAEPDTAPTPLFPVRV